MKSKATKNKVEKGLAQVKGSSGALSLEQVLKHPAFLEMSRRLGDVQNMLQNLPEAIGQAVATAAATAASRRPPEGATGPAMPFAVVLKDEEIKIEKGKLTIGDKVVYDVPMPKRLEKPRSISKDGVK